MRAVRSATVPAAIEKSKYLEKALAVSASPSRRKHRKRLLAK
jgi:hypothetical protein